MNINRYIDHTILKADATLKEIEVLCKEALTYEFYSVCVNGCHVESAAANLRGSQSKVCTVVGFPLGAMSSISKAYEAEQAIKEGAQEVDMVINIGWLKSGEFKKVQEDITLVKQAIGNNILKVIIETCFLTDQEKETACKLSVAAAADFVKTSTGFGTAGASIEDILLMRRVVGDQCKIKASGGIRDYATAKSFIDHGADRIGTSSGVAILNESLNTKT